jgi:DNA-binding MarR family transcriptional regulator
MMVPRQEGGSEVFPSPVPPSTEGLDPSTAAAYIAFQELVDMHQKLVVKHLTERGSNPAEVIMLRMLTANDGMAQRDIADALRVSRARVTHLVQALEAEGAVYRVRDPEDQRIVRVYLTESGRAREAQKGSIRDSSLKRTFGSLSEAERKELVRLLGLLTEGFDRSLQSDYAK